MASRMEAEKTENAMGRFFPGKAFASVSPFIRLIDTRVFAHNPSQITPSDFKTTMEDYKAAMPQDPRKHGIPGCVSLFSLYAKEYSNYVIYVFEAFDVGTTADSVIMILPSSCKQPRRPSPAHHEAVALLRVCKSWR